jgi:cytosine/adenosine deaminase-related metal-dependent hydrolase
VRSIKLGGVLLGSGLEFKSEICLFLDENNVLESLEGFSTCPLEAEGSSNLVLLPPPANSHTHLADWIIPEYGTELSIDELVAPPDGLKHRYLREAEANEKIQGYIKALEYAESTGTLLIMDYREGGIEGCRMAKRAQSSSKFIGMLKLLGRPVEIDSGEHESKYLLDLVEECDGFGLPSPLYYSEKTLSEIAKISRERNIPVSSHIAETKQVREQGDFEYLLDHISPTFIVHGTYLNRDDIELLYEKDIPVSVCPRSVLFHSTGIPPINMFFEANLGVMVGSDNAAWSTPDPWKDASVLYYIGRSQGIKALEFDKWILKGLFIIPYSILGIDPPVIEEEKQIHGVFVDGESNGLLKAKNKYAAIIKRVERKDIIDRFQ